ncbi:MULTISPECIES: MFS transporter [unclassified Corynebacterium]|uniref:MFS transporter n=1 Tax=unclassified Corynebacterium TaxID=2624378 RepID=UPI0034CE72CA
MEGQKHQERPQAGVSAVPGILIAVAGFSCLVVTLLQSIVVPAIPNLPGILGTSGTAVSWAVTATLLAGAVATPIIGRLADMYSRKTVMLVTIAAVVAGSIIAPLGNIATLIIGRALQGIGSALIPVAMAEMRYSLPREKIGSALAILSATLGIGGCVGIPLGGVLFNSFGWQSMFWIAAALSVISFVAVGVFVPSSRGVAGRFDYGGAVWLALGLSAFLTALSQGAAWGWASLPTVALFILAVVFFAAWIRWEVRQEFPLVNLRTTTYWPVLLTNLASILLGILMFTNLLLTTLELQNPTTEGGHEWSAAAAGLVMLPSAAAMLLVAPVSARLAQALGARMVITIGSVITALGYLCRLVIDFNGGWILVWATVISIGVGIGYAGLPMMLVDHVRAAEIGSANAVNALMRSIGMSISSALVSAVTAALMAEHSPSAAALNLLAVIGIVLGAAAVAFAAAARTPRGARGQE